MRQRSARTLRTEKRPIGPGFQPSPWTPAEFIAASGLFALGLMTMVNTVLNNAYSVGSTLYDSGFFQTIIWRSGWALRPAPTIDDVSFLNVHLSPINYLPNALSYLLPIDRMSYYGLVYGVVVGLMLLVTFMILRRQYCGRIVPAVIGSVLFYLSGPVNDGQWEPHQEQASSLFMLWFFLALGAGRPRPAVLMLVLNAATREDCGLILALPLLLLALHERWPRRERPPAGGRPDALRFAGLSILLSAVAFAVKLSFFNLRDATSTFYYGSPPFGHLSVGLIEDRLSHTILHQTYLWLPGLVLLVGAIWRRDPRLVIGWIAFFPYWLFNFLSKSDLNAALGSYKAFPLVVTLLWPAIIALDRARPDRGPLGLLQMAVLVAAGVTWDNGEWRLAPPTGWPQLADRWVLRRETEQAERYREFESRLDSGGLGRVRASMGVLALYPYSFPIWFRSEVLPDAEAEAASLDSLLWFAGDRDEAISEKWLTSGHFPYLYHVSGTRISLATRVPADKLTAYAGAIEPAIAQ
jgi:hypothetical protein